MRRAVFAFATLILCSRPVAADPSPRDPAVHARFLVVPVCGVIGLDVDAEDVRTIIDHALRRGVDRLVLIVDAGSGDCAEAEDIAEALRSAGSRVRLHAIVKDATGPGLWVAMACDTLHMTPGALIGAGADDGTSSWSQAAPEARSANRLLAIAEDAGRPRAVVRAMVERSASLYTAMTQDGVIVAEEAPPRDSTQLDGDRTLLTLSADLAEEIGFAPAVGADTPEALGAVIGVDSWRKASDFGEATVEKAREERRRLAQGAEEERRSLEERIPVVSRLLKARVFEAEDADPENFRYSHSRGVFNAESRRQWRQRTDDAVAA